MATYNSVGACRSGFSLLLSSRLYKTFVRPKFEYGLAICALLKKDYIILEWIQNKCLRMIVGGNAISSTMVLKHICNFPQMHFRANILITKFCIQAHSLPSGCLLSFVHQHHPQASTFRSLTSNFLLHSIPNNIHCTSQTQLAKHFESVRQKLFNQFCLSTTQVLIHVYCLVLEVDPILFLPATRTERSRLIR
ncbi:hypothetical protein PHYBLDRAFT_153393 [Phycomyces blakesleeanus NRRL 1555(-)]|uniref:Uncharacterized protein n=1 Tax=Phycomyces blakesleeanus (strain ATCC 8743b / DSM 1359 / FGSC 10004 / NBRC 33097 / NRRL 1555) TaxID=763407 RepID=A0A162TAE9_PHYB8|nr:hypothetical protein PHYBLDRAFT_153393 [Phycomyces blakesleeanus NRRL 1555(-)]OAD65493.1 hypothetical protein PHYBLDRAFT_153393 [Phycomyces blakesleeanus NRRL 1555(-)]|eukprot:XP_018283533.1 hypothetical protein PHYBLDRAFT_153393 [Phycomyces blakesleeanus NRRL 1555(-)]